MGHFVVFTVRRRELLCGARFLEVNAAFDNIKVLLKGAFFLRG